MPIIAHTMPFMIIEDCDLDMAHNCLMSLSMGVEDAILIVYNQGKISNAKLSQLLDQYDIESVILGNGTNVGIPMGRQTCFEYIWNKMPDIQYISEIHLDMIFTPHWASTLIDYMNHHHDEPMISPGIVTGAGELHPDLPGVRRIDIPATYHEIVGLLSTLVKEDVCEGLVHPVIHRAEILEAIGGYDTSFLKGNQGYEDDSLLLGYRYYMGIKHDWKPKALLTARVYHISLIQRMKMDNIQEEHRRNLRGLFNQYGAYGMRQLGLIHGRQPDGHRARNIGVQEESWDIKEKKKYRVLISSPIHQKPSILKLFLLSLDNISQETYVADYMFYDDNQDEESSQLLLDFGRGKDNVMLLKGAKTATYRCDQQTHYWKEELVWKVAWYKNRMIDEALRNNYDYLFLIDSDLLIYPHTIEQLITVNRDIVSNIFWTKWQPNQPKLPNVWLTGGYGLVAKKREEQLQSQEAISRYNELMHKLNEPGIYEVGGLGACTLISQKALESGVSFQEIDNLDYWGEDRHFCIRAKVLGHKLYVDTRNPAYHIYRESDIVGGKIFLERFCHSNKQVQRSYVRYFKEVGNRVTLSMIIRNEELRYLRQVLTSVRKYVDEAIIINDGSQDNSVRVCYECLEGIPTHIMSNTYSKFHNEVELRKQQWQETIKRNPDWILSLDADEIFEEAMEDKIRELINQRNIDVYYFRLYDFWDDKHYREDAYWCAHKSFRPFLIRYQKNFPYQWLEQPQHCGRLPNNIYLQKKETSFLRVKHYGWASYSDRLEKYRRYSQLDSEAKYGCREQYESILDKEPRLVEWLE